MIFCLIVLFCYLLIYLLTYFSLWKYAENTFNLALTSNLRDKKDTNVSTAHYSWLIWLYPNSVVPKIKHQFVIKTVGQC